MRNLPNMYLNLNGFFHAKFYIFFGLLIREKLRTKSKFREVKKISQRESIIFYNLKKKKKIDKNK